MKIVKPGKTPGKPIVEDYNGQRTAKGIVDAVVEKIPNHVKRVDDKTLESFLAEANDTAKVILFTDKGKTSALMRAVAIDFKGSVSVAQIRNTEKEQASMELFGISTFPTLLLLPGGKEAEGIVYDGELKKAAIVEFISKSTNIAPNPDPAPAKVKISKPKDEKKASKNKEEFESASEKHAKEDGKAAGTSATEELEEDATPSPDPIVEGEKPIRLPDPAPPIPLLPTEEQLEKECLGSRTGTCVLALLPDTPNEVAGAAISSLSEIAHRSKLHGRHLFPFYAVPPVNPAYERIASKLGLKGELDVIAINGRRRWWRALPRDGGEIATTDLSEEKLESWVDSIRLGEGGKQKLPEGLIPEDPEEQEAEEPVIVEDTNAEQPIIVEVKVEEPEAGEEEEHPHDEL